MKNNLFLKITGILFMIIACSGFLTACSEEKELPLLGNVHNHADFKVYLNGQAVNFAQQKYMSEKPESNGQSKGHYLSPFFHLHDMDGDVLHQHISGMKIGQFFETLGMQFTSDCFVMDDGAKYCNDGKKTLKMYVNGQRNNDMANYEFNDLDRILITYGDESEEDITKQMESVTDKACIQSEKCPERGKPHDESSCTASGDCIAPLVE